MKMGGTVQILVHRGQLRGEAAVRIEIADSGGQWLYMVDTTKLLAPGLRLAYLAGPRELIALVARSVRASVMTLNPIVVALATRWLEDGTARELSARRRIELASRVAAARRTLGAKLRAHLFCHHAWLPLPLSVPCGGSS